MSILSWLKGFKRRRRLDEDDFQEEVRTHLAMAARERMADGADPKAARQASLKDFGNVTLTKEAARRVWTPQWLDGLRDVMSDIRYAIRALAKNPAFALTVIGVLTLGIGLNAAVFTMLKSLALSPVAGVDRASRLAVILSQTDAGRRSRVSYPDYQYLRDHSTSFTELMGTGVIQVMLGRGRSARPASGELVTGNYFQVLGVRAAQGRPLLPSDEIAPGRHPVVVISDTLWRNDFAADPGIVGRTVEINNYQLTVVGVADPAFHGTILGYDIELFIPVTMAGEAGVFGGSLPPTSAALLSDRTTGVLFPQGFLRPGTTLRNAADETSAIWSALSKDRPLESEARHLRVVPFSQSPTGGQTYVIPIVGMLSAVGLLVLMIACANIAGLVLVRGVSRRGEIAVRLALGATRARIVRLLIIENLVLAVPGALLGLLLASQGIPLLVEMARGAAQPQRLFMNIAVDQLVIGFSAVIAAACALVFGLVPALQSSRIDLAAVIKADASARTAARGRLRTSLVVAQVAVSLLLLVGSGLVSRSVTAAENAYPGFDVSHVTAVALDVKQNGYDDARGRVFYRQLLETARARPGIESATLAAFIPLAFFDTRATRVTIDGYEPRRDEDLAFSSNAVSSDYFRTLRITLLQGRAFEDRDDEAAAPVAVVNRTLAERFFGGAANAVGKRLRIADGEWRTVVGVAADVKYAQITEAPRPYIYVPFSQSYRSAMILHTRGAALVEELVEQARADVAALDGDLPFVYARPLAERTRSSLTLLRFAAFMLFVFGTAGMALAALGTYGLVSYAVKQSTFEIGIRMALGASGLSVVRMFLERGLRLGAVGAAVGVGAALGVTRLLQGLLFGVSATDAVSFGRALAIVLTVVLVATLVPAWRASRTDPLKALRHQ